ncbi:GIY-YIG nuclease family protein [Chryseobacterium gotjawalense]|uniref:GIY-YIG nuclease family protein n=1 Tax=Chryseobacterium gotjawalense TaxID=3042315 RepID=A0ABY8RFC2_9FLAO|nr:GIY-YIG nuclease family protein [Chryseobacterium sp. wdc7]WHF52660.1 GIY-YIG nuclease family protein [Chryseobacterium sp. wdc7]
MKYFVYILYSASLDVYYKGFSTDVNKRLEYHLDSKHKFTSQAKDWIIVYVQEFDEKKEALKEEKPKSVLKAQSGNQF